MFPGGKYSNLDPNDPISNCIMGKGVLDGASMEDAFSVKDNFDIPQGDLDAMLGRIYFRVKYFVFVPIEAIDLEFENN